MIVIVIDTWNIIQFIKKKEFSQITEIKIDNKYGDGTPIVRSEAHRLIHRHGITIIYDRWNHSKAPPKKPPLSYNIITNKARHEFFYIVPKKRSIQDKKRRGME